MRAATLNNELKNDSLLIKSPAPVRSDSGFTMIEMCIALVLMLVGLLAMASAIGYGLMATNRGRNVTNTKLLIVSILEQMETLRNTKDLTFGQISNTGPDVDNAGATQAFNGFPTEFQPVSMNPGPDGIFGTTDDLLDPGTNGNYGDGDDFTNQGLARPGYSRQIKITKLSQDLKRIEVTLRYPGGASGQFQTMVATSYLNNDAHSNFQP
jgi:prepilin-type N-terminal cleavage/methylation domain-containing protein